MLHSVQHRAIRLIHGLRKVPYDEKPRLMDLPTHIKGCVEMQ